MNRSVQEVTFMAAKMKENGYRIPGQTDSVAESLVQESQLAVRKEKVKKSSAAGPSNEKSMLVPETNWSQEQQRALEAAIVKYRKTAGGDRWQKIANSVPEKTKEECLVRYKYLCELVKTQKKAEEEEGAVEAAAEQTPDETAVQEQEQEEPSTSAVAVAPTETPPPPPSSGKKLSKREQRRRKRDLSSDEDSDDAYQYEIS